MSTLGGLNLDRAQWRGLVERSNGPALWRIALHGGLILVLGAMIQSKVTLWPMLLLPQGLLLIFLFAPLHECIHSTAFKSKWCNDLTAHVCGWLVMLPPTWFRHFHLTHHRFTNNMERDPELAAAKPGNRRDYLLHMTGLTIWWSQMSMLLRNALGRNRDSFIPRKAHRRVTVEAAWFIALYAMAYQIFGEQLLWVWVVPALIGQPFLRGFLLAEHMGCPKVADMFANSRTTMTSAAPRFLTWNMSYHAEHHVQPAIPFHRLPAFHAHTRPGLKVVQDGYVQWHAGIFAHLA